jgi:hypothetical protein
MTFPLKCKQLAKVGEKTAEKAHCECKMIYLMMAINSQTTVYRKKV